ncbi:MAG: HYR domain-containing protein [Planctomycetes bacterium]|nr:HYR domain-containing protein [Planctomycetota bacterium]
MRGIRALCSALFAGILGTFVSAAAFAGGPIVLMGVDAEDGGVNAHGPITVYDSVVNSILGQTSNGGTGILVIGGGKSPTDNVTAFWNRISLDTGVAVTYVNGTNISTQLFGGFKMLAVVSDVTNTPSGGLTQNENNRLGLRQADVATFVNQGGGLFGLTSRFTNPYAYLAGIGAFTTNTNGGDYNNITPTPAGSAIGITNALDICCWHDIYVTFPAFLSVLATNAQVGHATFGQVAAIGGANVTVPSSIICPPPTTAECTGPDGATLTLCAHVHDNDGDALTVTWQVDSVTVQTDNVPAGGPPTDADVCLTHLYSIGTHNLDVSVNDGTTTTTCHTSVTVEDTMPPVLSCPQGVTAECTSADGAAVTFTVTAVDTCDPSPVVACDHASGSTFPIGSTTVCCTARDHATDNGNESRCCFDVTVVDTTPPTITCPQDITAECTGPNGAAVTFTATASDTCDPNPTIVCNPASGSVFPFGATTVCCTATDHDGNGAMCCFTVTVVDTVPPTIVCPQDIRTECTSASGAAVSFSVTATDTCDPTPTITCDHASGSTFPIGSTTVCCTAADDHENSSQCCFTVTVVDTTPPTITCPQDLTVECTSVNGAPATFQASATDTCDPSPTIVCVPASGSTFPFGTTQVCCTATDDAGNNAQCCFNVTVVDTTPPSIQCPSDITAECTSASGAAVSFTVTATDTCDPDPTIACDHASGSTFPIGSTTVCCTATDDHQNRSQCCFRVNVGDTRPPSITCPGDIGTECTSANGATVTYTITATDACDNSLDVTCNHPSGSTFPIGTTQVCCTATDDSGNRANCCFNVTVGDSTPPTIQCPDNISRNVQDVNNQPVDFAPSASDACDPEPSIVCEPPSGSIFPAGCTTVVCVASDDSGNSARCQFDVCINPCVGFDFTANGAVPDGTFISTQYESMGIHVDGVSETGNIGVLARHQGLPGSATDDLDPETPPNYLQTNPGDGTSDSGVVTFTFVDPETAEPRTVSHASLTFIDVEASGGGESRLVALDASSTPVATAIVPVGANGQRQTVSVDGAHIAMVVAYVGSRGDSAGIDQLCYSFEPASLALNVVNDSDTVHCGDTLRVFVMMRNQTGGMLQTSYTVYAGLRPFAPRRNVFGPVNLNMNRTYNKYADPLTYVVPIPNRRRIYNVTAYFGAIVTDRNSGRLLGQTECPVRVLPPR